MGNCKSQADITIEEDPAHIDRKITQIQKSDHAKEASTIKLLLLGAGETGKSTIFKQLKIIHENGYSKEERMQFRDTVHANVIGNMIDLIEGAERLDKYRPEESEGVDAAVKLIRSLSLSILSPDVTAAIQLLWADESMKNTYKCRNQFQLADSAAYFFDELDRIADPQYEPTYDDILRLRTRTTTIVEMPFVMNGVTFRLFDVGGQRTERRKWLHCFENTDAVIFVASLSEYDQVLYEDSSTNRLHESIKLFGDTCDSNYFSETAMLLFLNKRDLFAAKIKNTTIEGCFPDYIGSNTYDDSLKYITEQFLQKNTSSSRCVYVHVTCATDRSNIAFVFAAVRDVVLMEYLHASNF